MKSSITTIFLFMGSIFASFLIAQNVDLELSLARAGGQAPAQWVSTWYTLTVENKGTQTATGIEIIFYTPEGLPAQNYQKTYQFVGDFQSPGQTPNPMPSTGTYSFPGTEYAPNKWKNDFKWTIPSLDADSTATVDLYVVFLLDPSAYNTEIFAQVTALNETDCDSSNPATFCGTITGCTTIAEDDEIILVAPTDSLYLSGSRNGCGSGASNQDPIASFTVSENDLIVDFDASSSSDPDNDTLTYNWAFGDGSNGNGVTTSHTYPDTGTYVVTLIVDDGNGGLDTTTQSVVLSSSGGTGNTGSELWSESGDNIYFNSGKVGIGTDTPDWNFDLQHDIWYENTEQQGLEIHHLSTNVDESWQMYCSSTGALWLYQNNEFKGFFEEYSGNYVSISDKRLKTNVLDLDSQLDLVLQLNPSSYHFKNQKNGRKQYGFLAQEVEKVFPDLVHKVQENGEGNGQELLTVSYTEFIPIIVSAMQEQEKKNEEKTQQVEVLQDKVNDLEGKLDIAIAHIESLQNLIDDCCKRNEFGIDISNSLNEGKAQLEQNIPNPFYEQTLIKYYLPASVKQAYLIITDLNGRALKTFPIDQTGQGQMILHAHTLPAGTYTYTLVTDKEIVDTKQLVLIGN